MGNKTELKPCPFCGAAARLEEEGDHHGEYFSLGCSDDRVEDGCPGRWAFYTEPQRNLERSIAKWNHRALDDYIAKLEQTTAAMPDMIKVCERLIEVGIYNDELIYAVRKAKGEPSE